MSYHQRPHELRLAISSEAEALFSDASAVVAEVAVVASKMSWREAVDKFKRDERRNV